MEEQTINDFSEDLILQCLARLRYKDLLSASRVCRKWFRFLQTRHFYRHRKQLGYANQLACVLQSNSSSESNFFINVLNPISREWNQLPPIPNFINGFSESTQIASSDGKLVVISKNPDVLTASLFVWDFATEIWWKGKDLPPIWSFFFMVGFDSQIFIDVSKDDGSNSILVYDMRKDEWTELPRMSQKLGWCHEMEVIGDELWLFRGCRTKQYMFEHSAAVYHLRTGKWRLFKWDLNDSSCPCCLTTFELHESLKDLPELSSKIILESSRFQLGAVKSLVMVTTFTESDYFENFIFMRSQNGNFERIQPLSPQFDTYVRSSCLVMI